MKGQTNSTTQAIQVQPKETQGHALRPAASLKVKTNVKAGTADFTINRVIGTELN